MTIGFMDAWIGGPFLGLSIDDTKSERGWTFSLERLLFIPLMFCIAFIVSLLIKVIK